MSVEVEMVNNSPMLQDKLVKGCGKVQEMVADVQGVKTKVLMVWREKGQVHEEDTRTKG